MMKTAAEPGLNGRSLSYPRGKVLGGCSSVNGMIYMRGQAADYDHWRQLGNPGWGWDDVLPYFRRSEDHCDGESPLHGAGGEWRVERQRLSWDILRAVQEGAKEFGILPRNDFNDGSNEGSGFFQVNQSRGLRWNTARGFLRPAMRRGNLRVVTHALVRRILLEGRRATGVEWLADNAPFQALAGSEVILEDVYGYGQWFPLFFGAVAVLLAVNSLNNARLVQRVGVVSLVRRMAAIGLAAARFSKDVGRLARRSPLIAATLQSPVVGTEQS
jgi:choline dehydrogenase-like flavoprotein